MKVYARQSDFMFTAGTSVGVVEVEVRNYEADLDDDIALALTQEFGRRREDDASKFDYEHSIFLLTPFPDENKERTYYVPSDDPATDYEGNASDVVETPPATPAADTPEPAQSTTVGDN